jgi:hypothetical protein
MIMISFFSKKEFLGDQARADYPPENDIGNMENSTYYLDIKISDPNSFQTINVQDSLPYGYEYLPSTARVLQPKSSIPLGSATGTSWNDVRNLPNSNDYITIDELPISEPIVTPTAVTTTCDANFMTFRLAVMQTVEIHLKWDFQ